MFVPSIVFEPQPIPTITTLQLDGNRAGASGAAALAAALTRPTALRTLGLSMNAIGDEGGVALGRALQLQATAPTATLVDLDVSKNQLGAAACNALLMPAPSVTGLDSGSNSITGRESGTTNRLRRLNLFGNRVGDQVTIDQCFP